MRRALKSCKNHSYRIFIEKSFTPYKTFTARTIELMIQRILSASLLILGLFFLSGCFSKAPVRHLASDVCLMSQGTTRQEVTRYMGPPDDQQVDQYGEMWIYYQVNKSLLRKAPFIGDRLGTEDVDVVTIRFEGDQITACAYRSLTVDEFKKSGITSHNAPDGE